MRRRVIDSDEALRPYEQRYIARRAESLTEAIARDLGARRPTRAADGGGRHARPCSTQLGDAEAPATHEALELVDRALLLHRRRDRRAARLSARRVDRGAIARNAASPVPYFHLPDDRTIVMAAHVEL